VDATQDDDLPFRVPRFGVNAELTQYSSTEMSHQLDWMTQAHVNWVRQMVRWDEIEPQQGQYQWDQWDEINQFSV
jgi:beta-galactosidase GanA